LKIILKKINNDNYIIKKKILFFFKDLPFFKKKQKKYFIQQINSKFYFHNKIFVIAMFESVIVGLAIATKPEGGVGTILWLIVKKSHYKKGIGTILIKKIIKEYKNNKAHKIKITTPIKKNINFYKKFSFEIECYLKKHWWKKNFWQLSRKI
jgi:GNAT superfamily N-acetyltransferase